MFQKELTMQLQWIHLTLLVGYTVVSFVFWSFAVNIIYIFLIEVIFNIFKVLLKSCLKSPFLRPLQRLSVQEVLCVLKQKVYGFICTSLRTLWLIVAKYSKVLSTMHGPQFLHILGMPFQILFSHLHAVFETYPYGL